MGERTHAVEDRFWSYVDVGDCWTWTGAIVTGYGKFSPKKGSQVSAHRWAWENLVGPIREGLQLDHLCRNRACVNPDHLEPVTARENIMRGNGIARHLANQTHCKRGHEFTEENTYIRPSDRGRICRTCERDRMRAKRGWPRPKQEITHCPRGHEYTGANTYVSPKGVRYCRACNREFARLQRAKRRGFT